MGSPYCEKIIRLNIVKEILLASLFSLVYLAGLTAILRIGIRNPVKWMFRGQWVLALLLLYTHYSTSGNLGFLPDDGLQSHSIDIIVCVFFYIASISGGWIQLYNLADRGLSLRILIDILGSKQEGLNVDEVSARYSESKGIRWMYQKRLNDLAKLELIEILEGQVSLTSKGKKTGVIFRMLRKFYSIPNQSE